ncbi:kinase-like domain-containing protein [Catenaria anguillulae PL171]|uniref:Kinase-like domain-containing protein n=1 Tax=Catenaria anguillulae PL171 TaxID=765915 RepID=A0A1Y2I2H7_9FUNG|nr:kinase-like domain-containing protein [Catenaria anguillulae PL171]
MKHRVTGRTLAMKRFKKRFKSIDEVECLREIQALRRVNPHPNLVQLEDILFDTGTGTLYLAFELMDCNLYDLISKKSFPITEAKVKTWFYQICKGLEFIHSKGIFHRDIKPENILIREATTVKLADLGSCRGIHSKGPFTEYIATRWYRSPETLLTSGRYNFKMDMWGAGCVLYETITRQPLFPGSDALDQLHRIHRVFGSPSDSQLRAILGPKMEGKFSFPQVQGTGLTLSSPYDTDCRSLLSTCSNTLPTSGTLQPNALSTITSKTWIWPTCPQPSCSCTKGTPHRP